MKHKSALALWRGRSPIYGEVRHTFEAQRAARASPGFTRVLRYRRRQSDLQISGGQRRRTRNIQEPHGSRVSTQSHTGHTTYGWDS
ncbi:hypothetical protein FKM82_027693 [Ascaphus truei]